ncbi:MAG: trypsin-like serine protease [Planctomycetes bacterium]|nr:trypsin-like serine protease [Planctomycetota bacterium]
MLTAAHALFDYEAKWAGRPESEWKPVTIMFTPGARDRSSPFGSANATSWWISMPFFNNEDRDRDAGVIRLNRDLAARTGGFASTAEWPNEWTMDVTVYGYKYSSGNSLPRKISFRAYNTTSWMQTFRGWHQFYSSASVSDSVASVSGGASGGPAIARGGAANGKVVGVFNGIRSSVATNRMRGFRLSSVPLNELRAWVAANP